MNKINKFIKAYNLNDKQAARMLGLKAANLCTMKSGKINIPDYIHVSIDLHLDIPVAHQNRLKELALND